MTETSLIPIGNDLTALFVPGGLNNLAQKLEKKVDDFKAKQILAETKKGRDEIISFAAKVAKFAVVVDKGRISLVKDKKAALKIIDQEGKKFRDLSTQLKKEIRQPVTEYEEAEKVRIEEERQIEIFNIDHEEAFGIDDLFNREKALAEKEAEIKRKEEEKRQKEEIARIAQNQKERDARLKKEASEKAEQEAMDKIQAEKDKVEQLKREAREAFQKAAREKIAAEERAKIEREQAIQKAKDDMLAGKKVEEQRLAEKKKVADKKAANLNHQRKINNESLSDLIDVGLTDQQGKDIIKAIIKGKIKHVSIIY